MKAEYSEQQLLEGLARNERRCIETIYKDHFNMIQQMVLKANGTADDAKDVFQEALIVLYEKVKKEDFELNCLLKTYLYAVSKRLWLKKLHLANRFYITGDAAEIGTIADKDLDAHKQLNDELAVMEKAIGSLGEPCKSLLEAYYIEKKSMAEIAASFGYTNADNAKNQKYKCLMRLKKLFFTQYKNEL